MALLAHEQFPNKQLLVHYNQPHAPYIGPTGRSLTGLHGRMLKDDTAKAKRFPREFINGLLESVDPNEHRKAFRENVEIVMPYLTELVETIDGRTVVTADHGQMIRERAFPIPVKYHGHRHGVYVDELVEVPWFVYESGPRREITTERCSGEDAEVGDDAVVERLHDLGYMEY